MLDLPIPQRTTGDSTLLRFMLDNFRVDMRNVTSGRMYVDSLLPCFRVTNALFTRWTLLTSCFSHMEATHALFNGLTFYFMAPSVMQLLGNRHFLALYFLGVFIQRPLPPILITLCRWDIGQSRESRVESLL